MILQLSYYHHTQFLSHLKENIDLKQRKSFFDVLHKADTSPLKFWSECLNNQNSIQNDLQFCAILVTATDKTSPFQCLIKASRSIKWFSKEPWPIDSCSLSLIKSERLSKATIGNKISWNFAQKCLSDIFWTSKAKIKNTVKPWFNEPLYNEVLDITNYFLQPGQNYSKMFMEQNLDSPTSIYWNPHYNKHNPEAQSQNIPRYNE